MGNLEKLGILVIVILVVIVGVVAITPKERVDESFGADFGKEPLPSDGTGDGVQPLDPVAGDGALGVKPGESGTAAPADPNAWPLDPALAAPSARGTDPLQSSNLGDAGLSGSGPMVPPGGIAPFPIPTDPGVREVKVQKNETLAIIAKRELGSSAKWTEIVAANPGIDPKRLKIGQVVRIPVKAAPVATLPTVPGQVPAAPVGPAPLSPTATPAPLTPTAVPTPAPAPVAASKTYKVQRGDTLSDIARRQMGSAAKVNALKAANADALRGSDLIREGMMLTIPAATASAPAAVPGSAPATPALPTGAKSYTVESGDTLISIASRMLGSGSRYREIIRANEQTLHGSDKIRPGMQLLMPDVLAR